MSKERQNTEIRKALRSLLSDIEAMYEGIETRTESARGEEFFGPFPVAKLDGVEISDVSISWPNLAISMRNAKEALRTEHPED